MNDLTIRQSELLNLISQSWREGRFPMMSELAPQMGLAGESSVREILNYLVRKGFVEVEGGVRGRQNVISLTTRGKMATRPPGLPLLGEIRAGPLTEALENAETIIDMPRELLAWREGDFLLRVKGDSMEGDGILNGDVVLLRPEVRPTNGQIAAVHVGEEYQATLKHVFHRAGQKTVTLRASNELYPDLQVPADALSVAGVYQGLVRSVR